MIETPPPIKKHYNRQDIKKHYAQQFIKYITEDDYKFLSSLENVIDCGYCYGYNIVLEAAENVLSNEDYWKIVNKLEEWENENENN